MFEELAFSKENRPSSFLIQRPNYNYPGFLLFFSRKFCFTPFGQATSGAHCSASPLKTGAKEDFYFPCRISICYQFLSAQLLLMP